MDILELEVRKTDAVAIAKQLCYSEDVIKQIENAKNDIQISNILHDARKGKSHD